jgi:hypothetical protein
LFPVERNGQKATRKTAAKQAPHDKREAARRGKTCGCCGRTLNADEPIWRKQFSRCFCGGLSFIAPICQQCGRRGLYLSVSHGPCENCGRLVHETQYRRRRHHYCCEDCRKQHEHALVRRRRAEARGPSRPCTECGEHFAPTRADARFCSARCKQKAWRRALRLPNVQSARHLLAVTPAAAEAAS